MANIDWVQDLDYMYTNYGMPTVPHTQSTVQYRTVHSDRWCYCGYITTHTYTCTWTCGYWKSLQHIYMYMYIMCVSWTAHEDLSISTSLNSVSYSQWNTYCTYHIHMYIVVTRSTCIKGDWTLSCKRYYHVHVYVGTTLQLFCSLASFALLHVHNVHIQYKSTCRVL